MVLFIARSVFVAGRQVTERGSGVQRRGSAKHSLLMRTSTAWGPTEVIDQICACHCQALVMDLRGSCRTGVRPSSIKCLRKPAFLVPGFVLRSLPSPINVEHPSKYDPALLSWTSYCSGSLIVSLLISISQ